VLDARLKSVTPGQLALKRREAEVLCRRIGITSSCTPGMAMPNLFLHLLRERWSSDLSTARRRHRTGCREL
jgi:hypothetical protein